MALISAPVSAINSTLCPLTVRIPVIFSIDVMSLHSLLTLPRIKFWRFDVTSSTVVWTVLFFLPVQTAVSRRASGRACHARKLNLRARTVESSVKPESISFVDDNGVEKCTAFFRCKFVDEF